MTDLKELRKLVAFLRKQGITEYKDGGLELKLTSEVPTRSRKAATKDVSTAVNGVPGDGPTREELLYWSAGGAPTEPMDGN